MNICIAGNCGHGLSVSESEAVLEQIETVGYCRTYPKESLENLEGELKKLGKGLNFYEDYIQMLEKEQPRFVVIDSRFCDHSRLAEEALKRNISVYCEKPLATELFDLNSLKKTAKESKGKLFAMQSLRYLPWFYTAKCLADEGQIGKIRMINVQKSYKLGRRTEFFKNRETYGGTIPWVAIHGIDLILWISGRKAKSVHAFQSGKENFQHGELEMTAVCNFMLENEITANLQADYYRVSTAPTHSDDRLRIVGTEGVIEVKAGKVYLTNREYYEQERELYKAPWMIEDFLRYIEGSTDTLLDMNESFYSTEIALWTRESAETGKAVQLVQTEFLGGNR